MSQKAATDNQSRILAQELAQWDVNDHLDIREAKPAFVTQIFNIIAPDYDRFTRLFSFGMDVGWKGQMISSIARHVRPGMHTLDLACGTGDLTFGIARMCQPIYALGLDASSEMISMARRRPETTTVQGCTFRVGDMMGIDLPDQSVDIVTIGYGLRNVADYHQALREVSRVLKPGGSVYILDFYRPQNFLWRQLFLKYLCVAGSVVGWWWYRVPVVYGYIAKSIERYVSWQQLSRDLAEFGFDDIRAIPKLFGGVCIHQATLTGANGSHRQD